VVAAALANRFPATFDQPADLGSGGHPRRGGFLPPIPQPRRMWAGGEFILSDVLRGMARIFDRAAFSLNAVGAESGLRLWTADGAGRPALMAEAS
jgi:hydroxyacyl-ACP dehydratase HTD2-like protein with hotdog domain